MESSSITTIILGLAAVVGIAVSAVALKKSGSQKTKELAEHLQRLNIPAQLLDESSIAGKAGLKTSWWSKSTGVVKIGGRVVEFINITGVATQYGVQYYLDYLVRQPNLTGRDKIRRTRMKKKRNSMLVGKVVDVEWSGDTVLAQKLNYDYDLKDKLTQIDFKKLKTGIIIYPDPKFEYTRIRTSYLLPDQQLLDVIDGIARNIKSGL